MPASPSLATANSAQLTWSAWIKPGSLQRNAALYSRRDGDGALVIGLDDGAPFVEITSAGSVQRSAAAAPIAPGGWHHLSLTASPGLVTLYLDGNSYASLNATIPALNSIALIGGDSAPAVPVATPPAGVAPATGDAAGVAAPAAVPTPDASGGRGRASVRRIRHARVCRRHGRT
ncbi:MAG: LamG-like jellyroll fold domain-containing protein [Bradyrhizobium sp.]